MNKITTAITEKISKVTGNVCTVFGTLIGVRKTEEGYNYKQIIAAGWVFALGIPVLLLFMGPGLFSMPVWLLTVVTGLALLNLDDALIKVNKLREGEELS
jgi:hypothetical protein